MGLAISQLKNATKSSEGLLQLLFDGLSWPLPEGMEVQEIPLLDWSLDELHLNPDSVARLNGIRQLPPLTSAQTFGVFVLEFEGGRLPVGAVKRIVNRLVVKKRATVDRAHALWAQEDLLFFCQVSGDVRAVHVVAFQTKNQRPVLRVISWADDSTENRLAHLVESALPVLSWPAGPVDLEAWKSSWLEGFSGFRESLTTAKRLARAMADTARDVRDGVLGLYEVENDRGPIRTLAREMQQNLLDDQTPEEFADMFAETMVYGLLTSRITHPEDFQKDALAHAFRFDNPFLEAVYDQFRERSGDTFDVDELGLASLAEQLADADIEGVLADFGGEGRRDDPVVHFYEDFLEFYNPEKRIELGVYYTPQPVVRYIIRAVDELLKRDFSLPLGIADSSTWADLESRIDEFVVPDGIDRDSQFVSMLDPATGTGTFLVEWILHAEETIRAHARMEGLSEAQIDDRWRDTLTTSILPNIAAFEITMASYAVAHLKLSLALPVELRGKLRLPIFLTDTLKAPKAAEGTLDFNDDPISEERRLADAIKDERRVTVIVGNPPYRERAIGKGGIVESSDFGSGTSPSLSHFRHPGAGREEFNLHNLNVYFWRWATWKALVDSGGLGIVSFITTSPYMTSPAFKGMRSWIRRNSSSAYVVDCTPEGHQPPVNTRLFPGVQQPLAIMTVERKPSVGTRDLADVEYSSIKGRQGDKFRTLGTLSYGSEWISAPTAEDAPFVPAGSQTWESAPSLVDLMPFKTSAFLAKRPWPYAPHTDVLWRRWEALISKAGNARSELFKVTPDRDLERVPRPLPGYSARGPLRDESGPMAEPVAIGWRAFDYQFLIPDSRVLDRPCPPLWSCASGQQVYVFELHSEPLKTGPGLLFTPVPPESSYFKGRGGRTFPLWTDTNCEQPNVAPGFLEAWSVHLGAEVTPEAWIEYLAGVTGYSSFQKRFESDLVAPGIRVPITAEQSLFAEARRFGAVALAANTRRQRGSISDREEIRGDHQQLADPVLVDPISTASEQHPRSFSYDPSTMELSIGTGRIGFVDPRVMAFTTSDMNVFRKWFGYRKSEPSGRTNQGLNAINADHWYPEWTEDLLAMLSDLTILVELTPPHVEFLEGLLNTELLSKDDLGLE
jgi:hypothetical protein